MEAMNAQLGEDRRIDVKPWIVIPLILAALISELILPLPNWLLLRCVILGTVVGAMWAPRVTVLSWIGLGVMMLGFPAVYDSAYRRAVTSGQAWESRWVWETSLITWGVVALVASAPAIIRRLRIQPGRTDEVGNPSDRSG